jgi:hypothetical protein
MVVFERTDTVCHKTFNQNVRVSKWNTSSRHSYTSKTKEGAQRQVLTGERA